MTTNRSESADRPSKMPLGRYESRFWLMSKVTSAVFVENRPGGSAVIWQLCRLITRSAVFLANRPMGIDAKLVADKSLHVSMPA